MTKTLLLVSTAFVLLAPSAFATQDNSAAVSGSNNDLIQQTGNGNTLLTGTGAIGSATTNTANGGAGGNATANGGAGGSVIGSGNSSSVANGGQGGRGGDGGTGVGVGIGGNQSQSATTGNQSQNATTGDQSVNISNKRSAASAAPGLLVAAEDTCMGSSSAGAQGIGFGVSLGSTWTDGDCVRRKDARELHNMGFQPAAIALMCQSPQVRAAMETAGTPCAGPASQATAVLPEGVKDRSAYPSNSGSRNRY